MRRVHATSCNMQADHSYTPPDVGRTHPIPSASGRWCHNRLMARPNKLWHLMQAPCKTHCACSAWVRAHRQSVGREQAWAAAAAAGAAAAPSSGARGSLTWECGRGSADVRRREEQHEQGRPHSPGSRPHPHAGLVGGVLARPHHAQHGMCHDSRSRPPGDDGGEAWAGGNWRRRAWAEESRRGCGQSLSGKLS